MADVIGIPIGTVMSGLSRARRAFRGALEAELKRTGMSPMTQPRDLEPEEALV
jgi:hypothetical protein